jgi:hypothetical protein
VIASEDNNLVFLICKDEFRWVSSRCTLPADARVIHSYSDVSNAYKSERVNSALIKENLLKSKVDGKLIEKKLIDRPTRPKPQPKGKTIASPPRYDRPLLT